MLMNEITVMQLITKAAFIETFWRTLRECRSTNPRVTQREVFDMLNDRYEELSGEPRFSSFDSFRKCRDRRK